MGNVTLQTLTIEKFKGCRRFVFSPEGADAVIRGDNATGKTTVYDAVVWLLFGKDSRGRKDFDIKPLDESGAVRDHAAITSVEAEFAVASSPIKLKRTYYEKWTTKRGKLDAVYDGNESQYFVDDVPVLKNAFDAKVSTITDETTFRLLTNVTYFPETMKWQDRRALLFDLAAVKSEEEILTSDPMFEPLVIAANGRSVDDLKKVLTAKRKGLAKTKADTPTRIDEQMRITSELEKLDFAAVRQQVMDLDEKIAKDLDVIRELKQANKEQQAKAKLEIEESRIAAVMAQNEAFKAVSNDADVVKTINEAIRRLDSDVQSHMARNKVATDRANLINNRLEQLRNQYVNVANREFSVPDTCETCGQKLPKTRIETVKAAHEAEKAAALERIREQADVYKADLEAAQDEAGKAAADLHDAREELASKKKELAEKQVAKPAEDMPGYLDAISEINAAIEDLKRTIAEAQSEKWSKMAVLETELYELKGKKQRLESVAAQESVLNAAKTRIEELREAAQKAAAQVEEIDVLLGLIDEFSRFKAHAVEDSVNAMFEHAAFRLFVEQINGGLNECCDVVYNGVPYGSLNNGARINIGIDIIRTIGRQKGITVPLFVDNAESVTELWESGGQQIRLIVDENAKELMVE